MKTFYIDLKKVEPYIRYLNKYKEDTKKLMENKDSKFQSVKTIFDDANVENFLKSINSINTGMLKIIEMVDNYANVMKKQALAYKKYLGR